MSPTEPVKGLQWDVSNFRTYGLIGITNSSLVWNGTPASTWTTNSGNANWKGSIDYNDNHGAVFDDSANAGGPVTVNISGSVAPLGYSTTTVTNIVGNTTNVVITTNDPAMSPGLVISNATKDYIFAGSGQIRGMTSLYKTGSGTLSILNTTNNDFNGNVIVDGGTLVISNLAGASLGTAVNANNRNNDLIIDGATLNYAGLTNAGIGGNNAIFINSGGATIQVTSATNEFTINDKGIFANGSTGGLTKTGPGTLVLSPNISSYAGGTLVNNGTLRLTAAAAGGGAITLAGTSTLQLTNSFNYTNVMNITGAGTKIVVLGNNSTNVSGGAWTGSGTVTFASSNQFIFNAALSNFLGTIGFGTSSGVFTFNNNTNSTNTGNNPCRGSTSATFDLGTGSATLNNLNGGGYTYDLGALMGSANTILAGRNTNSAAAPGTTYAIGANGSSTVFSGKITNGVGETVSVVKVGGGTLALNGVSLYTGTTTVSNGTLGGNGVISGPLNVMAGGTLAPGTSVGTFTVSNNATLGGTVLMELNRALSPAPSNDLLIVTGTLTGGGALVVTNIGPDILNGSTFKLFNQGVSGFSSVTLPATDPSGNKPYTWNTNNLSVNGTITLVSGGINTNPTNITTSVSGNTLTLSWPADHIGWSLLSNSVGLTSPGSWFLVPGSQFTNQEFLTPDTSKTNVFFRMSLP
jgi:autotransporter-associated beta strand protein